MGTNTQRVIGQAGRLIVSTSQRKHHRICGLNIQCIYRGTEESTRSKSLAIFSFLNMKQPDKHYCLGLGTLCVTTTTARPTSPRTSSPPQSQFNELLARTIRLLSYQGSTILCSVLPANLRPGSLNTKQHLTVDTSSSPQNYGPWRKVSEQFQHSQPFCDESYPVCNVATAIRLPQTELAPQLPCLTRGYASIFPESPYKVFHH